MKKEDMKWYQEDDGGLVVRARPRTVKEWKGCLTKEEFRAVVGFAFWHSDTFVTAEELFDVLLEMYEGILPGPWVRDLVHRIWGVEVTDPEGCTRGDG